MELADSQAEKAWALRVCMKTVPGPVNLHTRPSLAIMLETMPPDATRSSTYLQFHATRWPLSMMYFSSFWSCGMLSLVLLSGCRADRERDVRPCG